MKLRLKPRNTPLKHVIDESRPPHKLHTLTNGTVTAHNCKSLARAEALFNTHPHAVKD